MEDHEPISRSRWRRFSTYVKEVVKEDAAFTFGLLIAFCIFLTSFVFTLLLLVARGFEGILGILFVQFLVNVALFVPTIALLFSRAFIPMRVILPPDGENPRGRYIKGFTHPKDLKVLGSDYIWQINGKMGIVKTQDGKAFAGRLKAPVVSDSSLYNAQNTAVLQQEAEIARFPWQKLDVGLMFVVFCIVCFLLLVLVGDSRGP